jgi:hypothetical protein
LVQRERESAFLIFHIVHLPETSIESNIMLLCTNCAVCNMRENSLCG